MLKAMSELIARSSFPKAPLKLVDDQSQVEILQAQIQLLERELEESRWLERHAAEAIDHLESISQGEDLNYVLDRMIELLENCTPGTKGMVRVPGAAPNLLQTIAAPGLSPVLQALIDSVEFPTASWAWRRPGSVQSPPELTKLLRESGYHGSVAFPLGPIEDRGVYVALLETTERLDGARRQRLEKGARLIGVALERHALQSDLHRSERLFRTLVVNSRVPICQVDKSDRIRFANPAWRELTGLQPEKYPEGIDLIGLFAVQQRTEVENLLQQRRGGLATSLEVPFERGGVSRLLRLSGGPLMDHEGNYDGSLESWTDISQDQHLRILNGRLAAAIEQSSEGILILDADSNIDYCNAALTRSLGFTPEELHGMQLSALFTPDLPYAQILDLVVRTGSWAGQMRTTCRNGSAYIGEAVISRLNLASDGCDNLLISCRDVTREVGLEQQVITAQKMEALGQFAGGVAHDFNNLLQVMGGFATLCMEQDLPQEERANMLEDVVQAAHTAGQLTKRLLSFARKQPMQRNPADLSTVVETQMRMMERLLGPTVGVTFVPSEAPLQVSVDDSQLEQLLLNLCVNARDAMPGGGRLTVTVEPVENPTFGTVPGPCALLKVTDTGTGMEPEVVSRIFEPFFTTKPAGQGTGLGLSVVYGIVQQHLGSLDVSSAPGRGTTFSILFPLHTGAERAAPTQPVVDIAEESFRKATILVVDDEPKLVSLATRILEKAGFTILTAVNGLDAERVFHENRGNIDALMLDLVMPKQGGLETWRNLEEVQPGIPVLFCSGYADEAQWEIPEKKSVVLMQKPYTATDLIKQLRSMTAMAARA